MLKIKNISKSFKDRLILNNLNIEINDGEVYGLIGPNGAGKTTLMNIITSILKSDSGEIFVDDKKIQSAKDIYGNIGYMLDIPAMYEFMTAYEYLFFLSQSSKEEKAKQLEKFNNLLETVGLKDVGDKQIKSFSRGMKQRMGICSALICDPKVILMDEPSSALDPIGRHDVIVIIEKLKNMGKTVLLSTHILSDVEKVCTKIGLLIGGNIRVEGTLVDIENKYFQPIYEIVTSDRAKCDDLFNILKVSKLTQNIGKINGIISVLINKDDNLKLLQEVVDSDIKVNSISLKKMSIEDIFIKEAGVLWAN